MAFLCLHDPGKAICALTNAVGGEPWLIPEHSQMTTALKARNAQRGIDSAYENLGIPKIMTSSDMTSQDVDELSIITYVSYFRDATRVQKKATASETVAAPSKPATSAAPPPWERKADWRVYTYVELVRKMH